MTESEGFEHSVLISDEGQVTRGRIPVSVVRYLGARAGDRLVFRANGVGQMIVLVSRAKRETKKPAKDGRSRTSRRV